MLFTCLTWFFASWSWRESFRLCRLRGYAPKNPHEGLNPESGAGGNRTLVQTRNQYAFYMFILAFIFVQQQDPSHQLLP